MSAEKHDVQRSTTYREVQRTEKHNSIACIAQWFNLYYPTVTSRILLVQSILSNYETSDTPPPDPPLQEWQIRKSIHADLIYFFSLLDICRSNIFFQLIGRGVENIVLALIKIYTVLALIKIYTVPVRQKILMSFCYVVRCKAADFIN